MPNSVPGVAPPKSAAGSGGAASREGAAAGAAAVLDAGPPFAPAGDTADGPLPAQAERTSVATPSAIGTERVRIRITVAKVCATLAASRVAQLVRCDAGFPACAASAVTATNS